MARSRSAVVQRATFKVHLDGYDQRDLLATKSSDPRHEFFYWTDDGNFAGLHYDQYKGAWPGGLDAAFGPISTFGPIPSSVRNTKQAVMTDGSLSTYLYWSRRRRSSGSILQASSRFRRGRSRGASRSTRSWKC
jgi:hypothetical protein